MKIYPPAEAKIRVKEIFDEVDFNGDGVINFSEYVTVSKRLTNDLPKAILKKAFDMFDLVAI